MIRKPSFLPYTQILVTSSQFLNSNPEMPGLVQAFFMKSKFTQETLHVEYDSNQGSDSSRKHHFVSGKTCFPGLVVSQNLGYLFGGPYNKDYNILGSILGSRSFGKLPLASSASGHAKLCFMRGHGLGMKRAAVRDAAPTLHPKLVSTKVVSILLSILPI